MFSLQNNMVYEIVFSASLAAGYIEQYGKLKRDKGIGVLHFHEDCTNVCKNTKQYKTI